MKPEVLLKAWVLHKSADGFVELVASTVDEVYSCALAIVQTPPHLVEETVLRVYWELARKAPRLGKNVVLADWLREHTCTTAVTILRASDRSADRAVLRRERHGLSTPSGERATPPGLATRVSGSILLNDACRTGFWPRLPRLVWPAWLRPVHLGGGAVCVLSVMLLWKAPFHRRNPIILSPELQLTPASYGQFSDFQFEPSTTPSQPSSTNAQNNRNQP